MTTNSVDTRPRALTSTPCTLAYSRTSMMLSPVVGKTKRLTLSATAIGLTPMVALSAEDEDASRGVRAPMTIAFQAEWVVATLRS